MKRLVLTTAAAVALFVAAPAWAADATLFGSATQESTDVKIVADITTKGDTNDSGGVQFPVAAGTTLGSLTSLGAEFNVTDDDCGAGSPRFQIQIEGKQLFVYLGPLPNFTGCATNTWLPTGSLVGSPEARFDASQFAGGTYGMTWAQVVTLLGSKTIEAIRFVVDAGWETSTNPAFTDKEQTVLVRNASVNGQTFTLAAPPTGGGGGGGGGGVNAAQLCKAERTKMGSAAAFNELWGTNAKSQNAFGKCVSTIAHARNAGKTQQQILDAIAACKAQGKKGAALGACVAATDGVAATKTEAQERAAASHGKKKGKKK